MHVFPLDLQRLHVFSPLGKSHFICIRRVRKVRSEADDSKHGEESERCQEHEAGEEKYVRALSFLQCLHAPGLVVSSVRGNRRDEHDQEGVQHRGQRRSEEQSYTAKAIAGSETVAHDAT